MREQQLIQSAPRNSVRTQMRSHYLGALFAILMGFAETACGQIMLEVKFIGLSGHLRRNDNPHLYRLKLDKKGRLAGHIGLAFGIEYFLLENCLSVKFGQAFMLDCGFQPAGFTHLGLRLYATAGRHSFAIGNGPTFFYRRDWSLLPNYHDEGLFRRTRNYQHIFFWYAGEVEYNYGFPKRPDFSLTFIPGPPVFYTFAPGLRWQAH